MNLKINWKLFLVGYLIVCIIGLIIILIAFWPREVAIEHDQIKGSLSVEVVEPNKLTLTMTFEDTNDVATGMYKISRQSDSKLVLSPVSFHVSDRSFIILVLTMGALGACLHGISSLALWVGQSKFSEKWILWYVIRPFSGAILAALFYLIIRGGFLPQVNVDSAGFYGIIGLSGLFGLFSKQAINKLSDLFDVIFASDKDKDSLKDQLKKPESHPVPQIESIEPEEISTEQKDVRLTIKGKDFVRDCVVTVEGEKVETRFVSDTEINAKLSEEKTAKPGTLSVAVQNPEPGGGRSGIETVNVKELPKQEDQ